VLPVRLSNETLVNRDPEHFANLKATSGDSEDVLRLYRIDGVPGEADSVGELERRSNATPATPNLPCRSFGLSVSSQRVGFGPITRSGDGSEKDATYGQIDLLASAMLLHDAADSGEHA
jgi:hypothetical protein